MGLEGEEEEEGEGRGEERREGETRGEIYSDTVGEIHSGRAP